MTEHCVYCGLKLKNLDWNTEHIIPLSCGGNNTRLNKRKAHIKCNSMRGNLPWRRFKQKVIHYKRFGRYEKDIIIGNIEYLSQFAEIMGAKLYINQDLYEQYKRNFSTSIVHVNLSN